jgi:hypothetical protein
MVTCIGVVYAPVMIVATEPPSPGTGSGTPLSFPLR